MCDKAAQSPVAAFRHGCDEGQGARLRGAENLVKWLGWSVLAGVHGEAIRVSELGRVGHFEGAWEEMHG
jgi:hypothetical protein